MEQSYECQQPCNRFQIIWTGDVALIEETTHEEKEEARIHVERKELLSKNDLDYPFAKVRELLQADYVVGNSEAPITTLNSSYIKNTHIEFRMRPESARVIRSVGFNAMGLANNHAFDHGPDGLQDSRLHLHSAGVRTFGAGKNLTEAQEPLIIDTPFGKVGVINTLHLGTLIRERVKQAGKESPGVNYITEDTVKAGAKLARDRGAKWLVAYVHWGRNYVKVDEKQRRFAKYFADSGYDLVIGHHPHVVQSVERIGKTLVMYSLGNFVFTVPGAFHTHRLQKRGVLANGLAVKTFIGPNGFEGVKFTCLSTDNVKLDYQARPCTHKENTRLWSSLEGVHLPDGSDSLRLFSQDFAQNFGLSLASRRKGKGFAGSPQKDKGRRRRRSNKA